MLCALVAVLSFGQYAMPIASAQVPAVIGFQGRITVNGLNHDGPGHFKFALVDAAGATSHWSNDGTSAAGGQPTGSLALAVTKGMYSVMLGDTTAGMQALPAGLFNQSDLRLRVWFNDGTLGFQQLVPDQRVAAVGYAMMSGSVADGAVTAAKIVDGAVGTTKLAPGAVTAAVLANNSVTTDKIPTGAVTPEKLSSSANFTLTNTGELFVKDISTNEPPRQLQGSVVIQWGTNSDTTATATLLASPAREITYLNDQFGGLVPHRQQISDSLLRRPLTSASKWALLVRDTATGAHPQAEVTLQFSSGPTVTMESVFPIGYTIEQGADGYFYETLTLRSETCITQ